MLGSWLNMHSLRNHISLEMIEHEKAINLIYKGKYRKANKIFDNILQNGVTQDVDKTEGVNLDEYR